MLKFFTDTNKPYGRLVQDSTGHTSYLYVYLVTYDLSVSAASSSAFVSVGTITSESVPTAGQPEATMFRIQLNWSVNNSGSVRNATITITVEDQDYYVNVFQSKDAGYKSLSIYEDIVFSGTGARTVEIWLPSNKYEPAYSAESYGDVVINDIVSDYISSDITWHDTDTDYGTFDSYTGNFIVVDSLGQLVKYHISNNYGTKDTKPSAVPFSGDIYSNTVLYITCAVDDLITLTANGTENEWNVEDFDILKIDLSNFTVKNGAKITVEGNKSGRIIDAVYHCEERPFLIYENATGGWDSFPINGNIIKTSENKYSGLTSALRGTVNFKNEITESYTIHCRISADNRDRLYNLLSSNRVYFNDFDTECVISTGNYHGAPSISRKTGNVDFTVTLSKKKYRKL